MPYEDDYKMWLEKMLIESNPDWVCDGMCDVEFTHEWCDKHCGEDSDYVKPKCLHMYYHHIVRTDRKTESNSEKPNNYEDFFREPTAEERKAVADYIDSISVPTGVNIFDLMDNSTISKMEQVETDINVGRKDEPQTDCPWK